MSAQVYNLALEAGVDSAYTFTWKDSTGALVNLTGYTAKLQIRTEAGSATLLLEKKTADGTIVLGGALGTIAMTFTAAQATALGATRSPMRYDLFLYSPTSVPTKLLKGAVTVDPAVTV